MAKHLGVKKIALATDPFQAGLLRRFTRKYCPGVRAIPIVFGKLNIEERILPEINSSICRVSDFKPITERERFFMRLRYTFGKRVKDEVRTARKQEQQARKSKK